MTAVAAYRCEVTHGSERMDLQAGPLYLGKLLSCFSSMRMS